MSNIIRVSKGKENPFVMINKRTLTDSTLTWEARGVLAYLLSKPNDWQVRVGDLIRQGPGGRQRMQRILKELETQGYIQRCRLRNGNGTFHWETTVYERPTTEQSTIGGKAAHGSAAHGKPVHIPRIDSTKNDTTKNDKKDTSAAAERPRASSGKNAVRKSLEEHFIYKTKIPPPLIGTVAERRAAGTKWWQPLRRIAQLCEWDENKAKGLIDAALLSLANITVVSPKSIVGTAEGIIGERARGVARSKEGSGVPVGPSSRARSAGQ